MKRRIDIIILPGLFLLAGYLFFYFQNHRKAPGTDRIIVYAKVDSTCNGSTLYVDGQHFKNIGEVNETELVSLYLSKDGPHEVRLSKPGKKDIVRKVQYNLGQVDEYLEFTFEEEHPFTQVVMQFDSSCAGGVLYIDSKKADSLQEVAGFEEKNFFFTQGDQHTVKMSKAGFSDVVYTVRYGSEQKEDYLNFSFATP